MTTPHQVALFAALCLWAGCDATSQQQDFVDAAQAPPSGFTETRADGAVVSTDEDDWRTAPLFAGRVVFDPVFPNPVSGGLVTLSFNVLQFDDLAGGVFVRAFDSRGQLVPLGESLDTASPGAYVITINAAVIGQTGLRRIFIQDLLGELISYGDLQIN